MINHKTSAEFRRDAEITSFIDRFAPRDVEGHIHDYLNTIIDAYEACEKERNRFRQDLEQIANADYRGNRSPESVVAYKSLHNE